MVAILYASVCVICMSMWALVKHVAMDTDAEGRGKLCCVKKQSKLDYNCEATTKARTNKVCEDFNWGFPRACSGQQSTMQSVSRLQLWLPKGLQLAAVHHAAWSSPCQHTDFAERRGQEKKELDSIQSQLQHLCQKFAAGERRLGNFTSDVQKKKTFSTPFIWKVLFHFH